MAWSTDYDSACHSGPAPSADGRPDPESELVINANYEIQAWRSYCSSLSRTIYKLNFSASLEKYLYRIYQDDKYGSFVIRAN